MSASLAVQKAIRARLIAVAAVTNVVPAANILDRNSRPAPDPSIIIGEDQVIEGGDIARRQQRVFSTLHIWKRESGLVGVKVIAGAIQAAIKQGNLSSIPGFHFADCHISDARFLRDPGGEMAHGVVTIETLVSELAP